MHLTFVTRMARIVSKILGQQMTAVTGGIHNHIVSPHRQAAIQGGFQGFVAIITMLKRQIITKHNEFLRTALQQLQ